MSEPVATRVDTETKQWLENQSSKRDESVSNIVAEIIEEERRLSEQPGTETETASVESRLRKLEMVLSSVTEHSKSLEKKQRRMAEIRQDITVTGSGLDYPSLVNFSGPETKQNQYRDSTEQNDSAGYQIHD
jgi:phage-related minor tail protein